VQSAPQLILVDLDGTLVGRDGHVSDRNATALERATAAGSKVVIATGRPARILMPLRPRLDASIALCYNGAVVLDLDTEEVLQANLLDGRVFQDAVERVRAAGHVFAVGVEGTPDIGIRVEHGYRQGFDLVRAELEELCALGIAKGLIRVGSGHVGSGNAATDEVGAEDVDDDAFEAVWDAFSDGFPDTLEVTRSGVAGLIEISAKGVSKGGIIAALARDWGVDPSTAIAFGDMPNDLEMFRWAGWSVAMGNAEVEVKLAASEVGADHDDDAVARVLERWF
jgi:hydroxymethylpyrimidine pyrophosphatase-like HAD family hydrolase